MPPWVEYNVTVPSPVVLTVNGNVNNPLSLTMSDLRYMGVTHVNLTLVSHKKTSYIEADSISLNALIQRAGPKSGATNVLFTGSDGYSATVTFANVTADHDSVIAFTQTQGLRNCLPTQAASYWVQNLTCITIQ
jgi:DMSO/TMAO reductase YedYZ molybdopterin-dependent catalytic subunit